MAENIKAKQEIIELFFRNVKGKKPDVSDLNANHDGSKGHWLERQFGIAANANNEPDLLGYELKNQTSSKTTFGDWSANIYVFTNPLYKDLFGGKRKYEKQDSFLRIFGKPNPDKDNRYSWSGTACPKINRINDLGQVLKVCSNEDIVVLYSYSEDKRPNKASIVPKCLQVDNLELARWYGRQLPQGKKENQRIKSLQKKLEDKFNSYGWFTCKTDNSGYYYKICFGKPMIYDNWIKLVNAGTVFFDSGMHEGNKRPYSEWRANNDLWDSLIYEEYETRPDFTISIEENDS